MALSTGRIIEVGETPYAHEQEGIDFAKKALPDTEPYHLWALVDLLDPSTGRLLEIDLLILGYSCLYVVELKAFSGRIEGDSVDWTWVTPDNRKIWYENPRRLTRRKAQILKTRLDRALPSDIRTPWIEPLVFLSDKDVKLSLTPDGLIGVVRRDNFVDAITRHTFPGADPRSQGVRIDNKTQKAVVNALREIGFRQRKGKRFVGAYELGELVAETDAYQDRQAVHRDMPTMKRRARTYLVPEQTSVERRQQLRRAADREVQLLYEVHDHPNILSAMEYTTDAPLGPTLLFEDFAGGISLDLFIRQNRELSFTERVDLISQVGRALDHCHKKGVLHGGVCPSAVLARRNPKTDQLEARLYNFQLGKGEAISATSHVTDFAADTWSLYQAPELANDSMLRTVEADMFALGALAFLVLTGKEPASSSSDRSQTLQSQRCLDPRTVDDTVPQGVAKLIMSATNVTVASRDDDAGAWVELLLSEKSGPKEERPPEISPLEAQQDDIIGDYIVLGVLGHGASARVLSVEDGDGKRFALKVSLGPEHDERLRAEAETLKRLRNQRIVELHEVLELAGRTCLLMSNAGEQTLYKELIAKGTISLDSAGRWGGHLLSSLEHLEEREVIHRDIKPANLALNRESKKFVSLQLFDFSLASTPLSELRVGTAAYRDPFLSDRGMWDHAADRYSAAVTLYEMLTGVRPTRGETGNVEIGSERFDPAVRVPLVRFFETAFHRVASERFASATEMLQSWNAAVDTRIGAAWQTGPVPLFDSQESLAAIAPESPIAALPLKPRAINALDRAGILTARDLLSLPENRLSAIRGVGREVAKEILEFRRDWLLARPQEPEPNLSFFPGFQGADLLVTNVFTERDATILVDAGLQTLARVANAPAAHIAALTTKHQLDSDDVLKKLRAENDRAGKAEAPSSLEEWVAALLPAKRKSEQHVRALFGLDGSLAGRLDVSPKEVAEAFGIKPPAVYMAVSKAKEFWAGQAALKPLTERVRTYVLDQGRAVSLELAAEWLVSELPHNPSTPPRQLTMQASAILRAIVEVEKDAEDGVRSTRIARDADHDEDVEMLWLVMSLDLVGDIKRLGDLADELAGRDVLVGPAEACRALRAVLIPASPFTELAPERLIKLAATASSRAAASPRLELYPHGMDAGRALALSASAIGTDLAPEEVASRVAVRYPMAARLPQRPELDGLLEAINLRFNPAENRYQRPGERQSSSIHTHVFSPSKSQLTPHALSEQEIELGDFDDRLRNCLERRSLLVLGVSLECADLAAKILVRRTGVVHRSFDERFLAALDSLVAKLEIVPEVVVATDAAGPLSDAWGRLTDLAAEAANLVAAELFPANKPLLLTEPGLIHRFQLLAFLQRLVAAAQDDRSEALILLCPGQGKRTPTIEGQTVIPGLLPGQTAWIPHSWVRQYDQKVA